MRLPESTIFTDSADGTSGRNFSFSENWHPVKMGHKVLLSPISVIRNTDSKYLGETKSVFHAVLYRG